MMFITGFALTILTLENLMEQTNCNIKSSPGSVARTHTEDLESSAEIHYYKFEKKQFQQLQPQKHKKETTTSSSAATCSVAYSTESPLRTYFWLLALYKSLVEVDGGLFCNQESEGFFWMVEFISWAHSRHIGYKHLEMFSLM